MNRLFVDTSAWAAIADADDDYHKAALVYQTQIAGLYRLVTHSYVLDELHTLLLMNVGYSQTIAFKQRLDRLIQKGSVEVLWVSEDLANQAWDVFERYNIDKFWSFTDCVSYVVMQQQNIQEVFSFDHHFSQMGFVRRP
jgi:uncharacterized protein